MSNFGGPFTDRRPWFAVYVTGRADLLPTGSWMYSPATERVIERTDALPLVSYLNGVLWKKQATHRIAVYCRAERTGVDCLVRAYASLRFGSYHLATVEPDVFGEQARYRRDLAQLARSHALVWYGPRENPTDEGWPDVLAIATMLGIDYRVVPFQGG